MIDSEILELAREWQESGYPAFVIELRRLPTKIEKIPTTANGHLDATTDPASFATMLSDARSRRPDAVLGVGIRPGPGGAVVLDYDTKNGARGGETLKAHLERFGSVMSAVTYRSVSGAINVILRKHDLAELIGNRSPRSWVDVDVRSDKGWIVPPGVSTPWGAWEWESGSVSRIPASVMPGELAAELSTGEQTSSAPADLTQAREWFDASTGEIDDFMARKVDQWCESLTLCANRNPTLFEALTELARLPADQIDRRSAFTAISSSWEARMERDGELGRTDEPWGVLLRIIGYLAENGPDPDVPGESEFDRRVRLAALDLEVRDAAKELVHRRKVEALAIDRKPIFGLTELAEYVDAGGDRCFWGTGDRILLARGESLLIAGREGTGKSTIALQVARAALGGVTPIGDAWKPLGHRVDTLADDEHVLYLALDRPRQIAGLAAHVLADVPGGERFILWKSPISQAVGADGFLEVIASAIGERKLGLVVVDSLKDVIAKLSSDEDASRWHHIRTTIVSELDVPMVELHHLKKNTKDSSGNDAIFGSAIISAGAGSIMQIDGVAGDESFLTRQTKLPALPVAPARIEHRYGDESGLWWTEVTGATDAALEDLLTAAGSDGITTPELIAGLDADGRSKAAHKKAVQRELDRLKNLGLAESFIESDEHGRVLRWRWDLGGAEEGSPETGRDTECPNPETQGYQGKRDILDAQDTPIREPGGSVYAGRPDSSADPTRDEPPIEPGQTLAFDLETRSGEELHDQRSDFVRLVVTEPGDGSGVTVSNHLRIVVDHLRAGGAISAHNGFGFDFEAIRQAAPDLDLIALADSRQLLDTFLVSILNDPPMVDFGRSGAAGRVQRHHGLDALAGRLGHEGKAGDLRKLAKAHGGFSEIPTDDPEYLEYARRDGELQRLVTDELEVTEYAWREQAIFARLVTGISHTGFAVDGELLESRIRAGEVRAAEITEWLVAEHGLPTTTKSGEPSAKPIATEAGKQAVIDAFADLGLHDMPIRTKSGAPSIGGDSMREILELDSDERTAPIRALAEAVLELQGIRSVYGTIADHCRAGRVHPTVLPLQASGRLSVQSPGLTVLGKRGGKHVEREVLVADVQGDELVLCADLSQIDARAVAAHAQDHGYLDLFSGEHDIHTATAIEVLGDAGYREQAKALNHGVNYGMGAGAMVTHAAKIGATGVTIDLAREFLDRMDRQYPKLARWKSEVRDRAEAGLMLDNGFGRPMRADDARAYTQAPALIGQGAARDLMMECLLRLDVEVTRMLRAIVHDELVFSVPAGDLAEVRAEIGRAMTFEWAPPGASRAVPIVAGFEPAGSSWGSCYVKPGGAGDA